MVKKKNSKKIPNLPKVEKELKDFIADEQGKMTRTDVAKLGVSLAVLGMMMQPDNALARHCSGNNLAVHNNVVTPSATCVTHQNVTSHTNNMSCHSSGGWGC